MKNKTLASYLSSNTNTHQTPQGIFSARVRHIILDDKTNPQIFKEYGEWASLGGIFFNKNTNPNPDKSFSSDSFALPLFPNKKEYPLKNELVYIISLPNNLIQSDVNNITYYYFSPINIWNNPHHNAIPDPINGELTEAQKRDYEETSKGLTRKVKDNSTEINLGDTFKEKINVKTLLPYEGDIIEEGRWGNSIRFGSTVKNAQIPNPWSSTGEDGDPITIIRNGQREEHNEPWIPQVEDINDDKSSIYITSTQKLPVKSPSTKYKSFQKPPTSIDQYDKPQEIFISDRVVIIAKKDSILLNSKKSIHLNAVESFNVDSPTSILQSDKVLLGDKNATEPIILGNKFLKDFKQLLTDMNSLCKALQTPIGTPVPYVPNLNIPPPAVKLDVSSQKMLTLLETYKSKISKSK